LVLQSRKPSLRFFDTRSWQRVDSLPDVPQDAVQYLPAAKKSRAVVRSNAGTVSLWDIDRHVAVAELAKDCIDLETVFSPLDAVFSPDESQVAVYEREQGWRIQHLRVWKTDSGKLVRELRPFEQGNSERMHLLQWSPDGRYLLAATKGNSMFSPEGISVWSIASGRHRGQFVTGNLIGSAILPDGSKLVAGCSDGHIRFFDFPAAMKQIHDFDVFPLIAGC